MNAEGTRQVALAARDAGARLVHVSSLAAAGPAPASAPRRETDAPHPMTPYGRSKLESERIVSAIDGLRSIIAATGRRLWPDRSRVVPVVSGGRAGCSRLSDAAAPRTRSFTSTTSCATSSPLSSKTDVSGVVFVAHPQPGDGPGADRRHPGRTRAPGTRRASADGAARVLAARRVEVAGRALRKPLPLNLSRYAEMAAEGFVCRVDRMRDELGVIRAYGTERRDRADGRVVSRGRMAVASG